ncbi:TPA: AraC family transcriptional regulator [Citrobacter freundii]|nr:AraC family transcriptional regulator [Citrobacter freundii]
MPYIKVETDRIELERTADKRARLAKRMADFLGVENDQVAEIPGLMLIRRTQVEPMSSYLCSPSMALVVQGRKRVVLGNTSLTYDESHFLLTAANLPTMAQVLDATPETPFLCMLLMLDLAVARQMITQIDLTAPDAATGVAGMSTGPATFELFDAMARLLALLDKPQDIPVLGELIQREVLYHVLTSPAGARLRQIVCQGTSGNRIARAIDWLRGNFTQTLRVEELAQVSGMGVSTLHHHFRQMTSMSPLQFQKHLRLHEARRLMLNDELDAGTSALRVGYESVTQFNREYRRLFGAPPLRDVKALRLGKTGNVKT